MHLYYNTHVRINIIIFEVLKFNIILLLHILISSLAHWKPTTVSEFIFTIFHIFEELQRDDWVQAAWWRTSVRIATAEPHTAVRIKIKDTVRTTTRERGFVADCTYVDCASVCQFVHTFGLYISTWLRVMRFRHLHIR